MSQTILVVDDDKSIVAIVRDYLEQNGFRVFVAYDGETALHILRRERPTLMILDLMLPGRDGYDITRVVRRDDRLQHTPIIMLTARVDDTEKIIGLELGADDYITKPFNPREVVARVRSVLRRVDMIDKVTSPLLVRGDLTLDLDTREVRIGTSSITLTPTQFNLLRVLMQHPGFVFTRAELTERAFGYPDEVNSRVLDNHIRNLRKKIEPDPNDPVYILTVYGVGYRFARDNGED